MPTGFDSYIFAVFSTDFTQLKCRAYFTVHFVLFFCHFDVVFGGRLNSPTEVRVHISSIRIQIAKELRVKKSLKSGVFKMMKKYILICTHFEEFRRDTKS